MKLVFVSAILILLSSCQDKIEITKEYIVNGYWNDQNNTIQISKMKIIDSTLNIFASGFEEEPNHWNIVNKIEVDSSYYAHYVGLNVVEPNRPRLKGKVYFNKDNGWNWSFNGQEKSVIGKLENGTWYKFYRLKMNTQYFLYVYVDSTGMTHKYGVNLANY